MYFETILNKYFLLSSLYQQILNHSAADLSIDCSKSFIDGRPSRNVFQHFSRV